MREIEEMREIETGSIAEAALYQPDNDETLHCLTKD